jgi:adenylosuccinate lyase
MQAWNTRQDLRTLLEADPVIMKRVSAADLDKVFDLSIHFQDIARTFKAVGL